MIQKFSILIICSFLLEIYSLNCRTEGSLKSDELKKIYYNCLKQQEGKNYSDYKNSSEDWQDRGSDRSEKERNKKRNREENKNREPVKNWMDDRSDRSVYESDDNRQNYHDQGMDGKNQYNYGKSHNQNDRRIDNNHRREGDYRTNVNNYQQNDHNSQDLYQNDEYESETQRNMYSYPNHRYKRDRSEKNSGQRSQYNPNTPRADDNHRERNSSESKDGGKACAMHCFLNNLQMTGENGMPDRYLATNAMTKDVRNEDLRDFLQESIEECFQILDNENTEDKCEFSKNLLICLSEKGRATCDDWKDDIQFN
ncbi:odorant-binding protein 59a-like [Pieris napi]|uniref:odorant-binding protein 59a-like n=1 Tax=Pieris napi TaxID=78633 RepID=UPI001FBA88EE|nr:odorant-binding protein 59a-like [Pieris napi]